MEKEAGSEHGGFMSPFGKPFVRDIWLLLPQPPLMQSLLKPNIFEIAQSNMNIPTSLEAVKKVNIPNVN